MIALRIRFLEDMQLHSYSPYSPKSRSCYVGAVRGLARFYRKSPDQISEEEPLRSPVGRRQVSALPPG